MEEKIDMKYRNEIKKYYDDNKEYIVVDYISWLKNQMYHQVGAGGSNVEIIKTRKLLSILIYELERI